VTSLLIVDDDVLLLSALSRYLAGFGFRVSSSSVFQDAKEHISSARPDILITDVRLGAFNGLQLAMLLRDVRPDARVVVFSGFDDPVLKEEARRIGAAYLVKPVSGQELVDEIQSTVGSLQPPVAVDSAVVSFRSAITSSMQQTD
jgi:two-component system, response regulator RegA